MAYFTIKQCPIFYSFSMDVKEQRKLDVFLSVLESSGIGPIIEFPIFGDGTVFIGMECIVNRL